MERLGHLEWQVPFEEGKIEAVGYRGGKEVKRFSRVTAGKPDHLVLRMESAPGRTGSALISAEICGKDGNTVVPSGTDITWEVENGELLGLGNGDPKSYEKNRFEKIKKRHRLDGFERLSGDKWVPYDTTGEPDKSVFEYLPWSDVKKGRSSIISATK